MKKSILIFSDWYLPAFKAGGPVKSVSNFVQALGNQYSVRIITGDRDFSESLPYPNLAFNQWTKAPDGANTWYFSQNNQRYASLKSLLIETEADFMYFNSMFSLFFTIFPLYILLKYKPTVKIVLAPRGMLHQGALRLKSPKKKVFLTIFKWLGWHKKILWQATDEQERNDIIQHFGPVAIKVVANLPAAPALQVFIPQKIKGEVLFAFFSRVSEKKNLHFFIERLKNISGKVTLEVWGNQEDKDYFQRCSDLSLSLPPDKKVIFKGAYSGEELPEIIKPCHFSVLPTLGENFGHSIFEGLSFGKPVIISDKTPWRGLEKEGCGWDIPLENLLKWEEVIQKCIDIDTQIYQKMAENSLLFAQKYYDNSKTIQHYKELFD